MGVKYSSPSVLPADSVDDTEIDWGTGTNQVSLDDVPDGATSKLGQNCSTAGSPVFAGSTVRAASPSFTLKDSDCTDADVNASIAAAATDTGTGAEDIDVTFSQQIAGVLTAFLTADADGDITFGAGRTVAMETVSF